MKFKYNGKVIETPNLEKKLKRMRLTLDDIEILEESTSEVVPKVEVKEETDELKPRYYFWNKTNNHTTWGYNPNPKWENLIWHEDTKTGLRGFNPEDWVLLKGKPLYPIVIGEDGTPLTE